MCAKPAIAIFVACLALVASDEEDEEPLASFLEEPPITAAELELLHGAIVDSEKEVLEAVLDPCQHSGADLDKLGDHGFNALHLSVLYSRDPSIIRLLISCGVNASVRQAGGKGGTALHMAITRGRDINNFTIMAMLLDALVASAVASGEVTNAADRDGHAPLHLAAWMDNGGEAEAVRLLLDAGTSIDHRNPLTGDSALHYAAQHGNLPAARLLLERGASFEVLDHFGISSLQLARWHEQSEVAALLSSSCGRSDVDGRTDNKRACDRPPHQPAYIQNPGDLTLLFERARSFQQYSPNVLHASPWVLSFESFLSDEEAQMLVGVCDGHFIRSIHSSQGVAKEKVRTSAQCWYNPRPGCNASRCRSDPVLQRVLDRIVNVTSAPPQNVGTVQVLEYLEGQYYATHHDQTHFLQPPLPEGARALTFFLYLNDVAEGGATHFPTLGITVPPRKGKALLWPSVMDDNPNITELSTLHEATPVISGTKYAANVWIHQYDYQTPRIQRRCAMDSFAKGSVDPVLAACQQLKQPPAMCNMV